MNPVYKVIDMCNIIHCKRYVCLYGVKGHDEYDNNTYMLVVGLNIRYYNNMNQRRTHICFSFGVDLVAKAIYAGALSLLFLSVVVLNSFVPDVDVVTCVAATFTRPGRRL